MSLPGAIGEDFKRELDAGAGCCSSLNTWRKEPLQDRRSSVKKDPNVTVLDPIFQVFLHCLGREWISGDALSLTVLALIGELIARGKSKSEAKAIGQSVIHYLKGERDSQVTSFIGPLPEINKNAS
jgi:hypothetical protein